MEYCDNCQKYLSQDKFTIHLGYCLRNIKKCQLCLKPIDKNLIEQHNQEQHISKLCQYCHLEFKQKNQYNKHIQSCQQKPQYCQYCQLNIPSNIFFQHNKQCQARTQTCQKCKKGIQKKEYYSHLIECQGKKQDQYIQSQPRGVSSYQSAQRVTRVRYVPTGPNNVIRHEIRQLGQRTVDSQPSRRSETETISFSNSYSTQPTQIQTSIYNNSYRSDTMSQYGQYQHGNHQLNSPFMSNQDRQLQAALFLSMGYADNQIYESISSQSFTPKK